MKKSELSEDRKYHIKHSSKAKHEALESKKGEKKEHKIVPSLGAPYKESHKEDSFSGMARAYKKFHKK